MHGKYIKIKSMSYGWLTFTMRTNDFELYFTDSYLDDFIDVMNYLLGNDNYEYKYFDTEMISRAIELDGEGTILKLSIMKCEYEDDICLTWWLDDNTPITFIVNYEELLKDWQDEVSRVQERYKKDFLMEEREE